MNNKRTHGAFGTLLACGAMATLAMGCDDDTPPNGPEICSDVAVGTNEAVTVEFAAADVIADSNAATSYPWAYIIRINPALREARYQVCVVPIDDGTDRVYARTGVRITPIDPTAAELPHDYPSFGPVAEVYAVKFAEGQDFQNHVVASANPEDLELGIFQWSPVGGQSYQPSIVDETGNYAPTEGFHFFVQTSALPATYVLLKNVPTDDNRFAEVVIKDFRINSSPVGFQDQAVGGALLATVTPRGRLTFSGRIEFTPESTKTLAPSVISLRLALERIGGNMAQCITRIELEVSSENEQVVVKRANMTLFEPPGPGVELSNPRFASSVVAVGIPDPGREMYDLTTFNEANVDMSTHTPIVPGGDVGNFFYVDLTEAYEIAAKAVETGAVTNVPDGFILDNIPDEEEVLWSASVLDQPFFVNFADGDGQRQFKGVTQLRGSFIKDLIP